MIELFKKIRKLFSRRDKKGAMLIELKEHSNKIDYNKSWEKINFKLKNRSKLSKMFD